MNKAIVLATPIKGMHPHS